MKDIQDFMRLIKDGPPQPEFLVKAIAYGLYQFVLAASASMGPPPEYLGAMEAAGYDGEAARSMWRLVLTYALGRTDDQMHLAHSNGAKK